MHQQHSEVATQTIPELNINFLKSLDNAIE